MKIKSSDIIYSEHGIDECFEYKDGSGRVPEGIAVGYLKITAPMKQKNLYLFPDVKYSECDHDYWDNREIEHDENRLVLL